MVYASQEDIPQTVEEEQIPEVGRLVILSEKKMEEAIPVGLAYVMSCFQDNDCPTLLEIEIIANQMGLCPGFFLNHNLAYRPQFKAIVMGTKLFEVSTPNDDALKAFLESIPLTESEKWLGKVLSARDLNPNEKERLKKVLEEILSTMV